MYVCTICDLFAGQSFAAVLRHIGNTHRYDPGLSIRCGIESCPEVYVNFESFRSHVYRKHRDAVYSCPSRSENESQDQRGDTQEEFLDDWSDDMFESGNEIADDIKTSAAKFLLKTREEHKVTQTTINKVVGDIKSLWSHALETVKQKVQQRLSGSSDSLVENVMECFDDSTPFDGLETEYLQHKYYKEHFHFVEPVERVLGRHLEERNGKAVEVVDRCYDVPLLESLQSLLQTESVRDQVMNSHSLADGMMGDYCDAELFQHHQLFKEDPCALQLHLYYDEVEVCNPIGSKAKIHKLGLLYYTLGNLEPKFRSCLKNIHLLSVAKYELIKKYGIEEFLKPVVESILKLEKEEGVQFDFDGQEVSFRGTLTIFSADNLAAWAVGGYKALGSAFRKCQFCMVTDAEMQTQFIETALQLRTPEIYKSHCQSLDGPLRSHMETTYGVVNDSILNTCQYFHVTEGMVPDIMHDVLEGSLTRCVRHLLIHYISDEKLFPLSLLNQRLASFKYGPDEVKNKPSEVSALHLSSSGTLRQSATQMWCLARFLPLMIGDQIPEGDRYWENFTLLLDIADEVFAPVTTADRADYLAMLVEDFLEEFTDLYPHMPLTPKMHHMVHFPTWIKRCGPLSRVWCMRYEAKHSYFKHLTHVLRNFKNIPKTLAYRHQHYMCYQMLNPAGYMKKSVSYTAAQGITIEDLECSLEVMLARPHLNSDTAVWRVRSATIEGSTYRKETVVIRAFDEDQPVFGEIKEILVTANQECLFVLSPLSLSHFNPHFHAYEVVRVGHSTVVCTHAQLVDHHPLQLTKSFGNCLQLFVSVKYKVICV